MLSLLFGLKVSYFSSIIYVWYTFLVFYGKNYLVYGYFYVMAHIADIQCVM